MKVLLSLLLILSSPLLAAENPLDEILKPAREALEKPDFPLSNKEVIAIFDSVDRMAPTLVSSADIPFTWIYKPKPSYQLYEHTLTLSKMTDGWMAIEIQKSPERLKNFKAEIAKVVAHEYGHALLNKNIELNSANGAKFLEVLKELARKNSTDSVPQEYRHKAFVYMAMHELFADTVAFAQTKDSEVMRALLKKFFGSDYGSMYERTFKNPRPSAHIGFWNKEMTEARANDYYSPYSLLWPQRQIIAELLINQKMPAKEVLHLLFQVIVGEINSWPKDAITIDSKELNERFSADLIERSKTIKSDVKLVLKKKPKENKRSLETTSCRDLF